MSVRSTFPQKAVILAAGKGSRMAAQGADCSKPMTLVHGKPLITHSIDALLHAGISDITIVYGRFSEDVPPGVTSLYRQSGAEFHFVLDDKQLGSLFSFWCARTHAETPFLLMDSDIIVTPAHFAEMLAVGRVSCEKNPQLDALVTVVTTPRMAGANAYLVRDRLVQAYNKAGFPHEDAQSETYQGGMTYLWLTCPFDDVGEHIQRGQYRFSDFFKEYVTKKQVGVMPVTEMWDVDDRQDVRVSEQLLKEARS